MKTPSIVFEQVDGKVYFAIDGIDPGLMVGESFESPALVHGQSYDIKVTRIK